jgi:predicted NAD/FAD-binding protein
LRLCGGREETFDRVVVAAHAPDALALLEQPTPEEERLLGAVAYRRNQAVLHTDIDLMPRRRAAWSAWNYVSSGRRGGEVTYWMNRLQGLGGSTEYLVSLNPPQPPKAGTVLHEETYEHPVFDVAAIRAQREFWRLQGVGGVWYCGAYFGSGFHEDGLQAGLAAAEAIGGRRRPWSLPDPSSRIHVAEVGASGASAARAA